MYVDTIKNRDTMKHNVQPFLRTSFWACRRSCKGFTQQADENKMDRNLLERSLVFETAFRRLQEGKPLLAMDALNRLPPEICTEETSKEPEKKEKASDFDWSQPADTNKES